MTTPLEWPSSDDERDDIIGDHRQQPSTANANHKISSVKKGTQDLNNLYGAESIQKSLDKDKADRATIEQVLDPRTMKILANFIKNDVLTSIGGCVSTGKEANVYHSLLNDHHVAIKIYKTSILVFRDREKYVTGEYRFKTFSSNPRKMVKMWAEKEMRNLKRLEAAEIPCPKVIALKNHVLLMDFLGVEQDDWRPSPRLKDAALTQAEYDEAYAELVSIVRRMYHVCKLVHGDLSEYNILWHNQKPYIIDVSQSMEVANPASLEFLRMDIFNVNEYFKKRGIRVLSGRSFFEYVTANEKFDIQRRMDEEQGLDLDAEDAVFKNAYIPRNLEEVVDVERDVDAIKSGKGDQLIYKALLNLSIEDKTEKEDLSYMDKQDDDSSDDSNEELESEDEAMQTSGVEDTTDDDAAKSGHSGLEDDVEDGQNHKPRGHKFESKDEKRERKKAVKEDKKERRKTKMPKAIKKAAVKKSSRR